MDAFDAYLHAVYTKLAALDITLEDIASFTMFGTLGPTEADIDRSARECIEGASASARESEEA